MPSLRTSPPYIRFRGAEQKGSAMPTYRGTMLWFNVEKGYGFLETAEGERLRVTGADFAEGSEPAPRCKGREVVFERFDDRVQQLRYTEVVEQRRARLRRVH